ncbi:TetR family transcriptional regulator [Nocardia mexicana]|uniref:TetR family transcriptional regulator n=2 Tax=Nocardia mexicana TaxID=279262 RepID=A0A370HA99_9NOCA|nr:TetR family transcriptional regulator [Nocardia mexicana]
MPVRPIGLRERKKQRTRIQIIETALDLCDRHGFEATTIEEIAAAAQVAPRTVTRYFTTKEDIVLGPMHDYLAATVELLRERPRGGNDLLALRDAYATLLQRTADGDEVVDFDRVRQMQRIIHSSPSVRARCTEFGEIEADILAPVLADRMDTTPDDIAVRLLVATWRMVSQAAMDEWARHSPDQSAESCRQAVLETFEIFRSMINRPSRSAQ